MGVRSLTQRPHGSVDLKIVHGEFTNFLPWSWTTHNILLWVYSRTERGGVDLRQGGFKYVTSQLETHGVVN